MAHLPRRPACHQLSHHRRMLAACLLTRLLAAAPGAAMASPDIPWDQRPWRQQRGLDEEQFKVPRDDGMGSEALAGLWQACT